MSNPVKLLLLYGGKSAEHEVSLTSAASVLSQLNADKYDIVPLAIDKKGVMHLHQYQDLLAFKKKLPVQTSNSKVVPSLANKGQLAVDADVVFPVLHGPLYEDGCLQGVLKQVDVAYVGSDVLASAVGMDKDISRRVACRNGVKCAPYKTLSWNSSQTTREQFCQHISREFSWPVFVKPCAMGSSVGIHKAHNLNELIEAVEDAFRYDETVLVEKAVVGREIELAVLENSKMERPMASVAGEICVKHPDGFYSYSAKYIESDLTELIIPTKINDSMLKRLQEAAVHIFQDIKCRGLARVDFFVDEKNDDIYFNEINTLPGFTPISQYPKLWEASGISYKELLDILIEQALAYHHYRQHIVTDYL